jgi:hypothetical protein
MIYQTMAEDHAHKSEGECHPYREFEGMQSSIYMKTSSASATGLRPWVSTRDDIRHAKHELAGPADLTQSPIIHWT